MQIGLPPKAATGAGEALSFFAALDADDAAPMPPKLVRLRLGAAGGIEEARSRTSSERSSNATSPVAKKRAAFEAADAAIGLTISPRRAEDTRQVGPSGHGGRLAALAKADAALLAEDDDEDETRRSMWWQPDPAEGEVRPTGEAGAATAEEQPQQRSPSSAPRRPSLTREPSWGANKMLASGESPPKRKLGKRQVSFSSLEKQALALSAEVDK